MLSTFLKVHVQRLHFSRYIRIISSFGILLTVLSPGALFALRMLIHIILNAPRKTCILHKFVFI